MTLLPLLLLGCPAEVECDEGFYESDGECVEIIQVDPPTEGPNWAWVDGDAVPAASAGTMERVTVPTVLDGLDYGLELGETTVIATGSTVRAVTPVTNTGVIAKCFVRLDSLRVLDAGGSVLASWNLDFIEGNAHVRESGVATNTCLGASQTGYFLGIDPYEGSIAGVTEVELSFDDPRTEVLPPVSWTAQPVAYREASPGVLEIDVENLGDAPVDLDSLLPFVLFDSEGPTWWGYANGDGGPLQAGETRTYTDRVLGDPAPGTEMIAWLDFD